MSWPTVTPGDIADRWRPLTSVEETAASTRLKDAEAELRTRLSLRGLNTPPTFDTVDDPSAALADWEQTYTAVVVEMVRRYLVNTEGWTEVRESIDDYSQTLSRRNAEPGSIYVTDLELDRLIPDGRPRRGAFSIRLGAT